jgi:hypothetical protein
LDGDAECYKYSGALHLINELGSLFYKYSGALHLVNGLGSLFYKYSGALHLINVRGYDSTNISVLCTLQMCGDMIL